MKRLLPAVGVVEVTEIELSREGSLISEGQVGRTDV